MESKKQKTTHLGRDENVGNISIFAVHGDVGNYIDGVDVAGKDNETRYKVEIARHTPFLPF